MNHIYQIIGGKKGEEGDYKENQNRREKKKREKRVKEEIMKEKRLFFFFNREWELKWRSLDFGILILALENKIEKNCKIHYMKRLMFHTIFTFLHKMFTYYTLYERVWILLNVN